MCPAATIVLAVSGYGMDRAQEKRQWQSRIREWVTPENGFASGRFGLYSNAPEWEYVEGDNGAWAYRHREID